MPATVRDNGRDTREQALPKLRTRSWGSVVSWMYLITALPTAILLCALTPPMQSPDEGRHFLRACQIASGRFVSEIEPIAREAGGWLPAAVSDFVKDKMTPDYFRREDNLHTVAARFRALDEEARAQHPLTETKFAVFPSATIYPPSLYLPQCAGIVLARAFSDKIYVWFYSARLLNAIAAVLVIFFAMRLAPAYQVVLVIPAMLPMSLFQISSVSSDAATIALSILFVALCARFSERAGLCIRIGIVVSLLLIVTGKPVYLPMALLTLASHKRVGWPRAAGFFSFTMGISLVAYGVWSKIVGPFIPLTAQGGDFVGYNPSTQFHVLLSQPTFFVIALLRTFKYDARWIFFQMTGWLGWLEMPLPGWLYAMWLGLFLSIAFIIWSNRKRTNPSKLLFGVLAGGGTVAAIFVAAFVLWTPVGSGFIAGVQGRYLIPVLPILAFLLPPADDMGERSRKVLFLLIGGVLTFSTIETVRIIRHCYFPDSPLSGNNIDRFLGSGTGRACPAEVTWTSVAWFSTITKGRAEVPGKFTVVVTDENGVIIGESDPVLADGDLSFAFPANWLIHMWNVNRPATFRYWLVTGQGACLFGPALKFEPHHIPGA